MKKLCKICGKPMDEHTGKELNICYEMIKNQEKSVKSTVKEREEQFHSDHKTWSKTSRFFDGTKWNIFMLFVGIAIFSFGVEWYSTLIALMIIGVSLYRIIKNITKSKKSIEYKTDVNESSIELLKKRYALGEISKEEFEEKKKDLENS